MARGFWEEAMGKQKVNIFFSILVPVFSKLIALLGHTCLTELKARLFEDWDLIPWGSHMVLGVVRWDGRPTEGFHIPYGHCIANPIVGWITYPLHQESNYVIVLPFLNPKLVIAWGQNGKYACHKPTETSIQISPLPSLRYFKRFCIPDNIPWIICPHRLSPGK